MVDWTPIVTSIVTLHNTTKAFVVDEYIEDELVFYLEGVISLIYFWYLKVHFQQKRQPVTLNLCLYLKS